MIERKFNFLLFLKVCNYSDYALLIFKLHENGVQGHLRTALNHISARISVHRLEITFLGVGNYVSLTYNNYCMVSMKIRLAYPFLLLFKSDADAPWLY